jgi:molecular chaperone GrpE
VTDSYSRPSPGPAGGFAGGPGSGGSGPGPGGPGSGGPGPGGPGSDSTAGRQESGVSDAIAADADAIGADAALAAEVAEDLEPVPAEPEDPITALIHERDDYRDALVRLQADFENYKKRMIKQQTDHLERASGALVDKLLPVLDTADLALAHGGGEDIKQVSSALAGVLEREGLERIDIDPAGARFDPTLHDAVAHEPGDGGEQEVVEVLRAGYRWKGRVLRPAMVKVRG